MEPMTDTAKIHPTDGPVHLWFGLSYSNYQVLPRTLMQSMPTEWQERMVACLAEMQDAFDHVEQADGYKVEAANEYIVEEMLHSDLAAADIAVENDNTDFGPGPDTRYHSTVDGREIDPHERVLLPRRDPVPHYNRGRTYIEPKAA